MISIEEKDVDFVIPNDGIGIVTLQPFLELTPIEPFRWCSDRKPEQLARIRRTLEISLQVGHGCEKTHFTIFPEYSIPGLDGVGEIEKVLGRDEWPTGTIVIGGIDGLNKGEYKDLCDRENTFFHDKNSPDCLRERQWVNCCITWSKSIVDNRTVLYKWIQPKIVPSWPEEDVVASQMFEGKCVYVFQGRYESNLDFRFMSLICFDWIGYIDSNSGIIGILKLYNGLKGNLRDAIHLHFVFVLEYNKKPTHNSFLHNAHSFFNDHLPVIDRDRCAIVLMNSAGSRGAGVSNEYGSSGFIFSPSSPYEDSSCPPSYAVVNKEIKQSRILGFCKYAIFRENGGCIHSLRLFHPQFVNRDVVSRRKALDPLLVYPLDETIADPRTTGNQISAIVKWINDTLDQQSLDALFGPISDEIGLFLRDSFNEVVRQVRWSNEEYLKDMVRLAVTDIQDKDLKSIDEWSEARRETVRRIIITLVILNATNPLRLGPAHAHTIVDGNVIDIIFVSGERGHQDNVNYGRRCYPGRPARITMIVSYCGDLLMTTRDGPIYEPKKGDPISRLIKCEFIKLKDCVVQASTQAELLGKIQNIMSKSETCNG